jgi:1-acyl-sn-glycerol-3-phosphate acyltransferase
MNLFRQLTGISTLIVVGLGFVLGDIWMLVVLTPWVHLRPASRTRVLGRFAQFTAHFTLGVLRHVGRAHIDIRATVPAKPGVIMVMNHQSLIDIPLAAACVPPAYPLMVARARYGRGIPLVSHMISLYGHILVQPGKTGRQELDALADTARAATLPILIFPEGHRTRDGAIRPWKRAGLDTFLSARDWEVYVVVVDGLWQVARLTDFVRDLSHVRCRCELAARFEYDGRGRDNHDEFVETLRRAMCDKLASMRNAASDQPTPGTAASSRE